MPFQMPTRLADGLGIGSSLSGTMPEFAPPDWVPRIRFATDLGCFLYAADNTLFSKTVKSSLRHRKLLPSECTPTNWKELLNGMYTRFFKVDRQQHVYLTFLAEAHEGLCTVSTVDQQQGIVRISAPPGREQETDQFILALQNEIGVEELHDRG